VKGHAYVSIKPHTISERKALIRRVQKLARKITDDVVIAEVAKSAGRHMMPVEVTEDAWEDVYTFLKCHHVTWKGRRHRVNMLFTSPQWPGSLMFVGHPLITLQPGGGFVATIH